MDTNLEKILTEATDGLLYQSESDYPFEYVELDLPDSKSLTEEQVRRWLDDISDFMTRAETFSALTREERQDCALKASRALRSLSDFLGALDVNSTHFWQLFAPDNQ